MTKKNRRTRWWGKREGKNESDELFEGAGEISTRGGALFWKSSNKRELKKKKKYPLLEEAPLLRKRSTLPTAACRKKVDQRKEEHLFLRKSSRKAGKTKRSAAPEKIRIPP